jgi:hypothetical protein
MRWTQSLIFVDKAVPPRSVTLFTAVDNCQILDACRDFRQKTAAQIWE